MARQPTNNYMHNNSSNEDPLPEGWEMMIDKATGWPFFVDHRNQVTTWQDPRKSQQYPTNHHQPGVREIPVIHEKGMNNQSHGGRQYPAQQQNRQQPHYMPSGQQNIGINNQAPIQGRQIPIQQQHHMPQPSHANSPSFTRSAPSDNYQNIPVQRSESGHGSYQTPASSQVPQHPPTHAVNSHPQTPSYNNARQSVPASYEGPRQPVPAPVSQPSNAAPSQPPMPEPARSSASSGSQNLQPGPAPAQTRRSVSPAPANLGPKEQIDLINSELSDLQDKVNVYSGLKKSKEYIYIEEMLTRLLVKLDSIESDGKDEIRTARRNAVKGVQATLDQLELKAMANEMETPGNNNMDASNKDARNVKEMVLDSEMKC